jgi:hypothetical protein
MTKMRHMGIYFMDGTKIVFKYPTITDKESTTIATKIKKVLNQDKIVVQTIDSTVVIPVSNIKYIKVTPPPGVLPDVTFKNSEIVE